MPWMFVAYSGGTGMQECAIREWNCSVAGCGALQLKTNTEGNTRFSHVAATAVLQPCRDPGPAGCRVAIMGALRYIRDDKRRTRRDSYECYREEWGTGRQ